jgi:hypothetical protein
MMIVITKKKARAVLLGEILPFLINIQALLLCFFGG